MNEQRALSFLIPCLLSLTIGILSWMALNVNRISETLAVMVYKSENHEKRIEFLESLRLGKKY